MCSEDLKIAVITHHVPLNAVSSQLTKELIIEKVQILNTALVKDFGIEKPIIGVLGLNPHASDNGVIGNEEEKIIRPAIVECKKQGILVSGPFAGDGFFGSDQWRKCDAVLAMYHDQGLIPFKMMSFGHGVNYTAGLSFVRTSPDHGTGFDIAGKNEANPSSIITALFTAMDIAKSRRDYVDSRQNALVKREKQSAGLND